MEKLKFEKPISEESRILTVQRWLGYLDHACKCIDASCQLPQCQEIKRLDLHTKSCKVGSTGGCPLCRQLLALCYNHAKHCQATKCPIFHCSGIKHHRQKKARIIQRRIAFLRNRRRSADVLQTSPCNSNSSNQPSPGAQPHSSPHPPQPGIGMKPSTGPPVGALQAVQLVQTTAAGQTDPHMVAAFVNYRKSNPVVSPPIPSMVLMAATQQMEAKMQNMEDVACFEGSGYAENLQSRQNPQTQPYPMSIWQLPNLQLGLRQPTQLMGNPNNVYNSIGNSAMGPPQVMPNHGPSLESMQTPTQAAVTSDSKISSISSATTSSHSKI